MGVFDIFLSFLVLFIPFLLFLCKKQNFNYYKKSPF